MLPGGTDCERGIPTATDDVGLLCCSCWAELECGGFAEVWLP